MEDTKIGDGFLKDTYSKVKSGFKRLLMEDRRPKPALVGTGMAREAAEKLKKRRKESEKALQETE